MVKTKVSNPTFFIFKYVCQMCKKPGKATISLDPRKRSEKWIDRTTPILIHYYHGTEKHYIGTWKNGSIHRSPSVDSFESVMSFD